MNTTNIYLGNNRNPMAVRLNDIQQRTNDIRNLQARLHDEQVMARAYRQGRLDPSMLTNRPYRPVRR